MTWLSDGIEKIVGLAHPTIEYEDKLYWRDTKKRVDAGDYPQPLAVHTLQALVDFCQDAQNKTMLDDAIIHVSSPIEVKVLGQCDDRQRRPEHVIASCPREGTAGIYRGDPGIGTSVEQMIVALMTAFVATEEQQQLIHALSAVSQKSQIVNEDDGMTQSVESRDGISLLRQEKMVSPIHLRPYTTFIEVEQPEILFRVRLTKNSTGVLVSLHRCDGGAWELEAIKNVAEWLADKLPAMTIYA